MTTQTKRLVVVCAVVLLAAAVVIVSFVWRAGDDGAMTERREVPTARPAPGASPDLSPGAGD